jgi:hypothetical protein
MEAVVIMNGLSHSWAYSMSNAYEAAQLSQTREIQATVLHSKASTAGLSDRPDLMLGLTQRSTLSLFKSRLVLETLPCLATSTAVRCSSREFGFPGVIAPDSAVKGLIALRLVYTKSVSLSTRSLKESETA